MSATFGHQCDVFYRHSLNCSLRISILYFNVCRLQGPNWRLMKWQCFMKGTWVCLWIPLKACTICFVSLGTFILTHAHDQFVVKEFTENKLLLVPF